MTRWSATRTLRARRRRPARLNEGRRAGDGAHLIALEHHERGRYSRAAKQLSPKEATDEPHRPPERPPLDDDTRPSSGAVDDDSAGLSVRCAREWLARYREHGEAGLSPIRSSAPRVANRTPQDRIEAIVALRRLRFTAAEIHCRGDRRSARDGALHGVGDPDPVVAWSPRAGAGSPLRAFPPGRARAGRRQEAGPIGGGPDKPRTRRHLQLLHG